MWLTNRYHHVTITAYNETISRGTGGLEVVTKGTEVSLNVLLVPAVKNMRYKEHGRFIEETFVIQVSRRELSNNSFTINVGDTHIVYRNNDYRVVSVLDAEFMNMVQLYQITCKRKIPVRDLA